MQLKCYINGVEYADNLVQGVNFAEEYNETLDSGVIKICGVHQIKDLKPYDDVIIYQGDYKGWGKNKYSGLFYKHLLIDQYSEKLINIDEKLYEYTIELFSETKKLETIQLPNVSITQPLNISKKRSVWDYIIQFLRQYNVKYKKAGANNTWTYQVKYGINANQIVDDEKHITLQQMFENVYCPDFTLNAPSLKDVLTQLMLTKDIIPYVEDDFICGLNISQRKGQFNFDERFITNVVGSMSSSNYANNLRRTYSNALSQEKSARRVEYLGFRNSETPLLTLENMRLETQFPIYKINKVYMCYYKKGEVMQVNGGSYSPKKYITYLCKQDITKLVLLNSTRNLLSLDWNEFNIEAPTGGNTIDELAQYKLCTLGYDIGSKYITGFGTKYEYPTGWWSKTKTYIENIATLLDKARPFGIYTYGYITDKYINEGEYLSLQGLDKDIVVPDYIDGKSMYMKCFNFIVDYDAFYNGSVVHSKEEDTRDDITINDNSSSSLTLLEKDGLFQKEKLNRFGNKAIQINATYYDTKGLILPIPAITQLQELGSVYDDDIIIYHREYSISDNCIDATYYGTKDYVLKNYFVSVYAKHRTYNLMSYGESVNRAENKKMYISLNKDKAYFENQNQQIAFGTFNEDYLKLLLSAFSESPRATTIDYFKTPNKINAGYITHKDKLYLTDANAFVSGYSLCFNTKMYDNVSAGVYIKDFAPQKVAQEVKKDFTGSVQDWNFLIDDEETGFTEKLNFGVGHINYEKWLHEQPMLNASDSLYKNTIYNRLFAMPKVITSKEDWDAPTNVIQSTAFFKDNKETIDMTMQFEPITNDKNILFSQWLMKLSELLSSYNKRDASYTIGDKYTQLINAKIKYVSGFSGNDPLAPKTPIIIFEMNEYDFELLDKSKTDIIIGETEQPIADFPNSNRPLLNDDSLNSWKLTFNSIKRFGTRVVDNDVIYLSAGQVVNYKNEIFNEPQDFNREIELRRVDMVGIGNACPKGKVWFSNTRTTENIFELFNPIKFYAYGEEITPLPEQYNMTTENVFKFNEPSTFNDVVYTQETTIRGTISVKNYNKNMYLSLSKQPLKKTLVYDELADIIDIDTSLKVSEVITYAKDSRNIPYLKVDLTNIPRTTQSLQYWFYDFDSKSYKFVFGVNINDSDWNNNQIKIYLSLLSTRDTRVYDDNHDVVGNVANYIENQDISYGEGQFYK